MILYYYLFTSVIELKFAINLALLLNVTSDTRSPSSS